MYVVHASFYVEDSTTEAEAEEIFENWLADVTTLDDDSSVAFNCVQSVIAVGEYGAPTPDTTNAPEAELREAA